LQLRAIEGAIIWRGGRLQKNYAAGDAGAGLRLLVEKAVAGVRRKVVGELSDHFGPRLFVVAHRFRDLEISDGSNVAI
jgi:nitrate/nitrite transporter NarK